MKQGRGIFFHVRQYRLSAKQWRRPQHGTNTQACDVHGRGNGTGRPFVNSKLATQLRHTLVEMGHPQPPTPVQTNNSTAYGVVTNNIMPQATKATDMHFHWLLDQEQQQHFRSYWRPGKTNYADFLTKHHPAAHHKRIGQVFLTPAAQRNSENDVGGNSISGGQRPSGPIRKGPLNKSQNSERLRGC